MLDFLRAFIHFIVIKIGKLLPANKNTNVKRLLIVRSDSIGDFILFTPGFEYIKKHYPKHDIDIAAQDYLKCLVAENPNINELQLFNYKRFRRNIFYRFKFLFGIYKKKYQICINPAYSRNWVSDEIAVWSNAEIRIGWKTDFKEAMSIYTRYINKKFQSRDHEIERNKFFLQELGISVNEYHINLGIKKRTEFVNKLWREYKLEDKVVLAVFPGTFTQYQTWDSEKFIHLINYIITKLNNVFFVIAGTGIEKNIIKTEQIGSVSVNICGKTNLIETYDLIKNADLILGYDSSAVHLAIEANTNSVCILGGGYFGRFMPYGDLSRHKFVHKMMDCFNCDWNCIYDTTKCIHEISVESVANTVIKLASLTIPNDKAS